MVISKKIWGHLITLTVYFIFMVGCSKNKQIKNEGNSDRALFKSVETGRIGLDGGLTRGVAWGDFDNDGDPDLYVANSNGQWNALYRNDGKGNFKKITAERDKNSVTIGDANNSQGVSWIDYDNDYDLDLYIVSRGEEPSFLFENTGDGFNRILDSSLVAEGISASMACWADIDLDGDLDVFLAGYSHNNVAFENLGDGNFRRVTDNILVAEDEGRARACGCGDTNNDGLPEFYVANARRPNFYYKNLGDWEFEKVVDGHFVNDVGYSYGVSWADYDNDEDLDLFVANFDKENYLYNNDGKGNFTPITNDSITLEKGGASKGHTWGDYDNDGDLDLYIANGTYGPDMFNFLFLNNGKGSFDKNYSGQIKMHADTSAGAAHADYDRDGDLDIFVANWGSRDQPNKLYENLNEEGNWISIRLKGQSSNSYGVGARVQLFTSKNRDIIQQNRWMYPTTGYASQNDYELHFGLGNLSQLDSIIVNWPSGQIDKHRNIKINTHWMAKENGELTIIN